MISRSKRPERTGHIALILMLTALALAPALASAQEVHAASSKKIEVHFSTSIVMGTKTLESGDYYLQCRVIDGAHYLVATSVLGDVEAARVPCKPETLDKKVQESEFRTTRRTDGTQVLTSVRFKGETVAHTVAIS